MSDFYIFLSDFLMGWRGAGHHRSRVWVVVRSPFLWCVGDFVCDSYFLFFVAPGTRTQDFIFIVIYMSYILQYPNPAPNFQPAN